MDYSNYNYDARIEFVITNIDIKESFIIAEITKR
jgi:hypothetical protein